VADWVQRNLSERVRCVRVRLLSCDFNVRKKCDASDGYHRPPERLLDLEDDGGAGITGS
jgi:hypothetical protein